MNKPGLSLPKQIPRCAVLNARFLAKPEACRTLYADIKSNNIDVCCISETWVKYAVPNHLICPSGFSNIRKDRTNCLGGGVAIICRNDWKMQEMSDFDNPFKCLWTEITTQNSEFYFAIVYHPPNPEYNDQDLIEFFIDSCEQLLSAKPN